MERAFSISLPFQKKREKTYSEISHSGRRRSFVLLFQLFALFRQFVLVFDGRVQRLTTSKKKRLRSSFVFVCFLFVCFFFAFLLAHQNFGVDRFAAETQLDDGPVPRLHQIFDADLGHLEQFDHQIDVDVLPIELGLDAAAQNVADVLFDGVAVRVGSQSVHVDRSWKPAIKKKTNKRYSTTHEMRLQCQPTDVLPVDFVVAAKHQRRRFANLQFQLVEIHPERLRSS